MNDKKRKKVGSMILTKKHTFVLQRGANDASIRDLLEETKRSVSDFYQTRVIYDQKRKRGWKIPHRETFSAGQYGDKRIFFFFFTLASSHVWPHTTWHTYARAMTHIIDTRQAWTGLKWFPLSSVVGKPSGKCLNVSTSLASRLARNCTAPYTRPHGSCRAKVKKDNYRGAI